MKSTRSENVAKRVDCAFIQGVGVWLFVCERFAVLRRVAPCCCAAPRLAAPRRAATHRDMPPPSSPPIRGQVFKNRLERESKQRNQLADMRQTPGRRRRVLGLLRICRHAQSNALLANVNISIEDCASVRHLEVRT